MKTLAEIVSDVHRNTPEEGRRLVRTMSCPSYLSKLSDSSNAIVSINDSRPQTGMSSSASKEKPAKQTMAVVLGTEEEVKAAPILPAKRSCSEQSAGKENIDENDFMNRPSKRLVHCNDERAADKVDAPLPIPTTKSQQALDPPEDCRPATSSNTVSDNRSRKRLSRSTTIDNSDIHIRPMKAMKQQSAAIETWKQNTIKSRQRSSEQQQQAVAKGQSKNNLLSNFVTYVDQLPSTSNSRTYEQVSLQSPSLRGSRQRQRSTMNGSLMDNDDGVPMCLMDSDTVPGKESHGRRSTQSTAVTTLSSKSLQQHSRRSNFSKLPILLRTFFVICSSLSFISRCLIWFGGRMGILYSMLENPMVWTLRLYISTFHLALIIVELGLGIPIILPRGETLTILTQRGFVQSFLGIIDLIMHSNKSMVEHISSLQGLEGALLSSRERRVQISYAIISVSARGMIFIGILYSLFGLVYDEYDGKRKKHSRIDDK